MLTAILQTVLTAIACAMLFVAFRRMQSDRIIAFFIAAGILLRALIGQAAFWISYLELPIARRLQEGRGFWFFATDAIDYYDYASAAADKGLGGIFSLDPSIVSPGYIQVLAFFNFLFGNVPSTSLLVNLAAYLGTCAIVLALAGEQKKLAAIAIAAISLSPASILWSTQPLKDVLFQFLFAAFVIVAAMWFRAWHREKRTFTRAMLITLLMLVTLCAIAAIRWYFAFVLLVTAAPLLFIASLRSRMPLRALALVVAMYGVVLAGAVQVAGPYLPPSLRHFITSPTVAEAKSSTMMVADMLEGVRAAFDKHRGTTDIVVGKALRESDTARFVSVATAYVLPRPVARATGLAEASGGRGLWLFADVDTVFFDVFLIIAIVALVRAKWQNPLIWLVAGATFILCVSFLYCIVNFGALFRYRSMIFLGVALIPVIAAWPVPRTAESRSAAAKPPLSDSEAVASLPHS